MLTGTRHKALAIKIFSAVPISMVEECAMSTVKWMNTARRNRQNISTVSDQLIIRNFQTLDSDNGRPKPPKPVTVNWRDIHKTIHHLSNPIRDKSRPENSQSKEPEVEEVNSSNSESENSVASDDENLDPSNPDPTSKHDPLSWLDEGFPSDLSSDAQPHFLLEEIFDIRRYLEILADCPPSNLTRMANEELAHVVEKSSRKSNAAALIPDDDAWTTWK